MGALQLKPWEFERCTPKDVNDLIDGYEWRMNRSREQQAYWVCTILNGAGRLKTAVRPERVLGRPIGEQYDHLYSGRRTTPVSVKDVKNVKDSRVA